MGKLDNTISRIVPERMPGFAGGLMVISTGVLHSWENPAMAINECYRVLRPGKEAGIYDPAQIVPEGIGEARRELIRGIDRTACR